MSSLKNELLYLNESETPSCEIKRRLKPIDD